ncbi:MAG: hypothetical protein LBL84_03735 [Candidatus Nomurabacteria bacterium]|nr:hypothetical protein [Candidatus Nomurabacteria bacterium]
MDILARVIKPRTKTKTDRNLVLAIVRKNPNYECATYLEKLNKFYKEGSDVFVVLVDWSRPNDTAELKELVWEQYNRYALIQLWSWRDNLEGGMALDTFWRRLMDDLYPSKASASTEELPNGRLELLQVKS